VSAQNVELLKAAFPRDVDLIEVFASEDPIAALVGDPDVIALDLEVRFTGGISGAPALEFRGADGLLEGWRDWLEPYDSYRIHFDEAFEAQDKVVTYATVRARTSRHGVEVEHHPGAVWTFREGKLVAVSFFLERDKALQYAGVGTR
jgi:ketosteroid isomerase-like protein